MKKPRTGLATRQAAKIHRPLTLIGASIMQTDRLAGKMLASKPTGLSVQHAIYDVRNRALEKLKDAEAIAEGLQSLDAAIQVFSEDRSSSEMQALVDAARQLSDILNGQPAEPFDHTGAARRELTAAKQVFTEDRGVDEMQRVITAARNLSKVMAGLGVAR